MKHTTMVLLLLTGGGITVQGCVSRSSGDYVLMQLDPGNCYVLQYAQYLNGWRKAEGVNPLGPLEIL
jgi:hypothetical protein